MAKRRILNSKLNKKRKNKRKYEYENAHPPFPSVYNIYSTQTNSQKIKDGWIKFLINTQAAKYQTPPVPFHRLAEFTEEINLIFTLCETKVKT